MAATVTAMRKAEGGDERAALRAAIEDVKRIQAAVDAQHGAIERAQRLVWEARRRFEATGKAIAEARIKDAQQLAAALTSGEEASPQAAKQAKEAETEAGEALAMVRAAHRQLEADLKDSEHEAARAAKDVTAAIAVVLKPAAQKMIEEAQRLRVEYLKRQHAIDAMAMSLDGFKHLDFSVRDDEYRALCATVRQPWLDVIKALREDPDAALPPDAMTAPSRFT
jgi:hypothetical protein